jgi:cell division transport system permease protein
LKFSTGGYLLGETGKSIWRNKMSSFLSCATTALSLFLLGVAFLINLNLNFVFTVVQNQMEIQAYFKQEVTEEQGRAVAETVAKLPGVSTVAYVSRDDALTELKTMFQDKPWVLDGLGTENPLPPSVRVKTSDVAIVPDIAGKIKEISSIEDVIYDEGTSRQLASIGHVSQYVSLGGMLVVGLVAVMVIGNSIRLTIDARRHEIGIMKLVGATDEFIIGPFLLEGVFLGMLGGLLGEAMVVSLYIWVVGRLGSALPFIPVLKLTARTAADMLGVMLVTGVAVGTIGSVVALRRHLKV